MNPMDVELNGQALYAALDEARWDRRLIWREVVEQTGASQQTVRRLRDGENLNADSLIKILSWLGTYDLEPFIKKGSAA